MQRCSVQQQYLQYLGVILLAHHLAGRVQPHDVHSAKSRCAIQRRYRAKSTVSDQ